MDQKNLRKKENIQTFYKLKLLGICLSRAKNGLLNIDFCGKFCWLCVCQLLSDDDNFMIKCQCLPKLVVLHVYGKVLAYSKT